MQILAWIGKRQNNRVMKKCSKCKIEKEVGAFSKRKISKDGYYNTCIMCNKKTKEAYLKSVPGVITRLYNGMVSRTKRKNHPLIEFSKEDFRIWLLNVTNFQKLYEAYQESNYNKLYKPSVDRIDDYKPYIFDNMQVVSWLDNYKKSRIDAKNGNNTKNCRAVLQLDKNSNLIKEHFSMADAGKQTNISWQSISACCRGVKKSAGGFKWKFKHKESIKHKHNLQD